MESKWSDAEAQTLRRTLPRRAATLDVALRVYSSRLIGGDASLVLHGGGNTSVKTVVKDDLGRDDRGAVREGQRLGSRRHRAAGLARACASSHSKRCAHLDALERRRHGQRAAHAHARRERAQPVGRDAAARVLAAQVHRPLARRCDLEPGRSARRRAALPPSCTASASPSCRTSCRASRWPSSRPRSTSDSPGSKGCCCCSTACSRSATAREESTSATSRAVDAAERLCRAALRRRVHAAASRGRRPPPTLGYARFAPVLRGLLGDEQRRYVLCLRDGPRSCGASWPTRNVASLSQRGCATPDHVIRTKRFPLRAARGRSRQLDADPRRARSCVGAARRRISRGVRSATCSAR